MISIIYKQNIHSVSSNRLPAETRNRPMNLPHILWEPWPISLITVGCARLMVTGSIYNKNHELVLDQEKPYPKIWGQGKLSKVKYLPWTPLVKDQREVNYKYFDPASKYLSKKLWRVVFSLPQSPYYVSPQVCQGIWFLL